MPNNGDPRMLWLQWVWSHYFLSSFFRKFFVGVCTFLSLVLTIDFCYSQLIFLASYFKNTKKLNKWKKIWNVLKKNELIKEGWGGSTFKLWRDCWGPTFNFSGGPGVPFLILRGVPGPTSKLWGGSSIPGPSVSGSHSF